MRPAGRRLWGLAVLAGGLAAGCRGPSACVVAPPPSPPPPAVELPVVTPGRIEPYPASLPTIDPNAVDAGKLFAADPASFRGLTEPHCRALAAARSPVGNLLDVENTRPEAPPPEPRTWLARLRRRSRECDADAPGAGLAAARATIRQARSFAAQDARNRDAAEALDRFFQLADAEARADLLARGLAAFDRLRAEAEKMRAAGLPAPAADELLRQRAKLLADAEQAEAGIRQLNTDLKARIGLPTGGPERLWPTGDFAVRPSPVDAEAAVRFALENRPDLLMGRTLYHGLSADALPAIRDLLRAANGLLGGADPPPAAPPLLQALFVRRQSEVLLAAAAAEVETRRRQLFDLIAAREMVAAAEVRAAVVALDSAARRVALARSRVESWKAKIDDLGKKGARPAEVLQAEAEWLRARGELVAEVMGWHRARVKLGLAVGRFE